MKGYLFDGLNRTPPAKRRRLVGWVLCGRRGHDENTYLETLDRPDIDAPVIVVAYFICERCGKETRSPIVACDPSFSYRKDSRP